MVLKSKMVPKSSTRGDGDDVDDDNARVPCVYGTPGGELTMVGRDDPLPSPFGEALRSTLLGHGAHLI